MLENQLNEIANVENLEDDFVLEKPEFAEAYNDAIEAMKEIWSSQQGVGDRLEALRNLESKIASLEGKSPRMLQLSETEFKSDESTISVRKDFLDHSMSESLQDSEAKEFIKEIFGKTREGGAQSISFGSFYKCGGACKSDGGSDGMGAVYWHLRDA